MSFYSTKNLKNQNFERKKKKTLEDIIILHLCTTSNDQMIYGSWDIKSNRQNFLSCWAIFCPFIPITTRNLKKWKKPMEISSFYTCVPQMAIIWCMVSEKWSMTDRLFCHFGPFFALPLPSPLPIYHFTQVYQKSWSYAILFLRYGTWQM